MTEIDMEGNRKTRQFIEVMQLTLSPGKKSLPHGFQFLTSLCKDFSNDLGVKKSYF